MNKKKTIKVASFMTELMQQFEKDLREYTNEKYKLYTDKMMEFLKEEMEKPELMLILILQSQMLTSALAILTANSFLTLDQKRFKMTDGKLNIDYLKKRFDDSYNNMIESNISELIEDRQKEKDIASLARKFE